MNTELSCGGCQRGFLMVKCIRESSVLPFSACWYTDASVWPSDIHWVTRREHKWPHWLRYSNKQIHLYALRKSANAWSWNRRFQHQHQWSFSPARMITHSILPLSALSSPERIPGGCRAAWCPFVRRSICLPPPPRLRWSCGRSRWSPETCSAGGRWGWRGLLWDWGAPPGWRPRGQATQTKDLVIFGYILLRRCQSRHLMATRCQCPLACSLCSRRRRNDCLCSLSEKQYGQWKHLNFTKTPIYRKKVLTINRMETLFVVFISHVAYKKSHITIHNMFWQNIVKVICYDAQMQ